MKYDYKKIRKKYLKTRKKRIKYCIKKYNKLIAQSAATDPDEESICIGTLNLLTENEKNDIFNFFRQKGFNIYKNEFKKYFISWEEHALNDVE